MTQATTLPDVSKGDEYDETGGGGREGGGGGEGEGGEEVDGELGPAELVREEGV